MEAAGRRQAGADDGEAMPAPWAIPSWSQCCQQPLCSGLPYLFHAGNDQAGVLQRRRVLCVHTNKEHSC